MRAFVLLSVLVACKYSSPTVSHDAMSAGSEPPIMMGSDSSVIDTPTGPCDPTSCATAMGTCNASGHCEIHHDTNGGVVCPGGLFCDVYCNAANDSCQSGAVDCTLGVGCNIFCGHNGTGDNACADAQVKCPKNGPCAVHCDGDNACRNHGVACGNGTCAVDCIGLNACQDIGVQCGNAASCAVDCNGNNACANESCSGTPGSCTFNCCGTTACGSTCGCNETNNC